MTEFAVYGILETSVILLRAYLRERRKVLNDKNWEALLELAKKTIIDADEEGAMTLIESILGEERRGQDVETANGLLLDLLRNGFARGNQEAGNAFEIGLISIPELILSSELMKCVTDKILEHIVCEDFSQKGTFLIATVAGDVHDIGKGIVVTTMRAAGFNVIDLGRDASVEEIVVAAQHYEADIIATSALLTSTLTEQRKLEEYLKRQGLRGKYITMVGGAPCTLRWAKKIGADGYGGDGAEVPRIAEGLLEAKKESKKER